MVLIVVAFSFRYQNQNQILHSDRAHISQINNYMLAAQREMHVIASILLTSVLHLS